MYYLFKNNIRTELCLLFCIIFILLGNIQWSYAVYAENMEELIGKNEKSILVGSSGNNQLVYTKNITSALPIASLTKIMAMLLVYDEIASGTIKEEDTVVISEQAATISHLPGASNIDLRAGESYTVSELIDFSLISSANGAVVALADAICGSEKHMVDRMNERAKELKLSSAYFTNTTGLPYEIYGAFAPIQDERDNRMSAYDLYVLSSYIVKTYPEMLEHSSKKKYNFKDESIENTNKVLWTYENWNKRIRGLKTGTTEEAGYCQVVVQENPENVYTIFVVLGSSTKETRLSTLLHLLSKVEKEYRYYDGVSAYSFEVEHMFKEGNMRDIAHRVQNTVLRSHELYAYYPHQMKNTAYHTNSIFSLHLKNVTHQLPMSIKQRVHTFGIEFTMSSVVTHELAYIQFIEGYHVFSK